ncbi:NAD-binding protein [Candidatus Pelagibacter sp.]|nr:NAD-binding protein [Candidatus Pelagibacter sp.]
MINGNGLDEDVLNEANIDEVETVLALTNDDEDSYFYYFAIYSYIIINII